MRPIRSPATRYAKFLEAAVFLVFWQFGPEQRDCMAFVCDPRLLVEFEVRPAGPGVGVSLDKLGEAGARIGDRAMRG